MCNTSIFLNELSRGTLVGGSQLEGSSSLHSSSLLKASRTNIPQGKIRNYTPGLSPTHSTSFSSETTLEPQTPPTQQ